MFTLPDKGTALNDTQCILFKEYIDPLVAGISGVDFVSSGCAVTPSAGLTVAIASGTVYSNSAAHIVTGSTLTHGTADATNPRFDFVVVSSSGTLAIRAGTAASAPVPPTKSANDVVLAVVYIPAGNVTIAANQIVDLRVFNTAAGVNFVSKDQNYNNVGSYCLCAVLGAGVASGATVAGSGLSPASASLASGSFLTGTWRCCGYSAGSDISFFQRIV